MISTRGACTLAYVVYLVASGSTEATKLVTDGRFMMPGPGWPTSAPMSRICKRYYGPSAEDIPMTIVHCGRSLALIAEFTPPSLALILVIWGLELLGR